jgi:hypothetical protein
MVIAVLCTANTHTVHSLSNEKGRNFPSDFHLQTIFQERDTMCAGLADGPTSNLDERNIKGFTEALARIVIERKICI